MLRFVMTRIPGDEDENSSPRYAKTQCQGRQNYPDNVKELPEVLRKHLSNGKPETVNYKPQIAAPSLISRNDALCDGYGGGHCDGFQLLCQ